MSKCGRISSEAIAIRAVGKHNFPPMIGNQHRGNSRLRV